MVEVVVALEHPMVLDDPVVLLADEGAQHCGGNLGVVGWGEMIADVVQQHTHNGLLVLARAVSTRGCL